jgi:hypothetical protein
MPRLMPLSKALSILYAHTAKHSAELVIDAELNSVAMDLILGDHDGLFETDLAEAIHTVWDQQDRRIRKLAAGSLLSHGKKIEGLGCLVVDPEGHIDVFLRVLVKEKLDE